MHADKYIFIIYIYIDLQEYIDYKYKKSTTIQYYKQFIHEI